MVSLSASIFVLPSSLFFFCFYLMFLLNLIQLSSFLMTKTDIHIKIQIYPFPFVLSVVVFSSFSTSILSGCCWYYCCWSYYFNYINLLFLQTNSCSQFICSSQVPRWLQLLLTEKFYNACIIHEEAKKNEKNVYCLDCCISLCPNCLSPHTSHRLLQVLLSQFHFLAPPFFNSCSSFFNIFN